MGNTKILPDYDDLLGTLEKVTSLDQDEGQELLEWDHTVVSSHQDSLCLFPNLALVVLALVGCIRGGRLFSA